MAHPSGGTRKHASFERERGVHTITVSPDVAHVSVDVPSVESRASDMSRVFHALDDAGVPISFIKIHAGAVTFAVQASLALPAEEQLRVAGFGCSVKQDLAILKITAGNMRDLTGVLIRIADSLTTVGARMYATGDSHDSVLCLIDGPLVHTAVTELNRTFGLDDVHA